MDRWECLGVILALCWLIVRAFMGCIGPVIFAAASGRQVRVHSAGRGRTNSTSP